MGRLRWRVRCLLACLMATGAGCGGERHIEQFSQANGDKPDAFELGHVQVCPVTEAGLFLLIGRIEPFARRHGLTRETIRRPGERIVAVYTRGTPMRVHLMVERLHARRYRVGISTEGGFDCEGTCGPAAAYDFCPRRVDRQ